jgi:hypothetical protein
MLKIERNEGKYCFLPSNLKSITNKLEQNAQRDNREYKKQLIEKDDEIKSLHEEIASLQT